MNKLIGNMLIDKWCQTYNDKREVTYQGKIIDSPEPGYYLLQILNQLTGQLDMLKIVSLNELSKWDLYENYECMV